MKLKELVELVDNDTRAQRFIPIFPEWVYYDVKEKKYWLYSKDDYESDEDEAYEVEIVAQLTYNEDNLDEGEDALCPYDDGGLDDDWYDLCALIESVANGMELYGIDVLWFDIVDKEDDTRFERVESFHPY